MKYKKYPVYISDVKYPSSGVITPAPPITLFIFLTTPFQPLFFTTISRSMKKMSFDAVKISREGVIMDTTSQIIL